MGSELAECRMYPITYHRITLYPQAKTFSSSQEFLWNRNGLNILNLLDWLSCCNITFDDLALCPFLQTCLKLLSSLILKK